MIMIIKMRDTCILYTVEVSKSDKKSNVKRIFITYTYGANYP